MTDSTTPGADPQTQRPTIDTTTPHSARITNYWLGGKDNYHIDREVGAWIIETNPQMYAIARASRAFLRRAVAYLVNEAGIRQFLDIGTGMPSANNIHEVAQALAPESRVVYVDHDPLVLTHARALLTSTSEGATDYIDADLREPEKILRSAAHTLDFNQPTALMLMGILGHITDDAEAQTIVNQLLEALPSGSYLTVCDDTNVVDGAAMDEMVRHWNEVGTNPRVNRTPQGLAQLFDHLELVEPGLVSVPFWRPASTELDTSSAVDHFGGIGQKP